MSILLNALERAQGSVSATDLYVRSSIPGRGLSEFSHRNWLYLASIACLVFVLIFRSVSGIQVDKAAAVSVVSPERDKQTSVLQMNDEVTDRNSSKYVMWARYDAEKIMHRLKVAPETLVADRDAIMNALLDAKAWHVAHMLSQVHPSVRPSLAERKMLAVHALESDDYNTAHAMYSLLTQENMESAELWIGLGMSEGKLGHYADAYKAFSKAIHFMGEDHVAYEYVLNQLDLLSS